MIDITAIFNSLQPSKLQENHRVFHALPLPIFSNHRIGKSSNDKPILFLSGHIDKSYHIFPNIKLQNLTVTFNVYCNITSENIKEEGIFTIIKFLGDSTELQMYFLKLSGQIVENLGNNPTQFQIHTEIYRLIELLKNLSKPPIKTVQGLFAELIVIEQAKNLHNLIKSWHNEPTDKYDFTYQTQHLEVKSTSSGKRRHHFSLEQISPPKNHTLTIASVFVEQNNGGITINELKELILKKTNDFIEAQNILNLVIAKTLGSTYMSAQIQRFNYELAKKSILFYSSKNLLQINPACIPNEITDIHLKLDMSNVSSYKEFSFELEYET